MNKLFEKIYAMGVRNPLLATKIIEQYKKTGILSKEIK